MESDKESLSWLQLAIPDYHRASIAVAQKSGYKFEGIARGATFNKGQYVDLCIYSMLREECQNIENLYDIGSENFIEIKKENNHITKEVWDSIPKKIQTSIYFCLSSISGLITSEILGL